VESLTVLRPPQGIDTTLSRRRATNTPLDQNADDPYRPDIDGLRAIAILSVIAGHVGLPAVAAATLESTYSLISGFLISSLLLNEADLRGDWTSGISTRVA